MAYTHVLNRSGRGVRSPADSIYVRTALVSYAELGKV